MTLRDLLCCGALVFAGAAAYVAPLTTNPVPAVGPTIPTSSAPSVLRDPLIDMVDEAMGLIAAADAAGGLEMEGAGFHNYPGDPMGAIYVYTVSVPRFAADGVFQAYDGVRVDVRPANDLQQTIRAVDIVDSPTHARHYDVLVQLTQDGIDLAKQRQIDREDAYAAGRTPRDQGVALVAGNFVYAELTYGELWSMAVANDGWATIVSGTSVEEAGKIAQALEP